MPRTTVHCHGDSPELSYITLLKGIVARDFPPPIFHQKYPPRTLILSLNLFKFVLKFVELLELKVNSPLHHAAGWHISPRHYAAGNQIS